MLAAAVVDSSVLLGSVGYRRKTASRVCAVAEGLSGALAAGAPVVGLTGFDLDGDGGFLGDGWFGHNGG